MLKIGLTGNLGSGKSLVAGIFRILKVPVYIADDVSRSFLEDREVKEKVRDLFGSSVFLDSGAVDRKMLGHIVFSDPKALLQLNAILHPLVGRHFANWCSLRKDSPYIILEAAIIFESGLKGEYDRIINVSCPVEIAIERAIRRDNSSRENILKRMNFQWPDDKKASLSDYIIYNDGREMVIPQVLKIHEQLTTLSFQE